MPPPAGAFIPETEYNVLLTVRKGARERGPRQGQKIDIKLRPSEGFDVLRAKVLNPNNFRGGSLISEDIFIKRGKNQSQSAFVLMTEETFLPSMTLRWNHITENDVAGYQRDNGTVFEKFKFEFFIYIHKQTQQSTVPTSLRRATASRIAAAAENIRAFEAQHPQVRMGDITRNHVTVAHARRVEGSQFEMPTDNTTRQAQALDEMRREVAERDDETERQRLSQFVTVEVQVKININQLREALGLPAHDLFRQGIFHGYEHPSLGADQDIVDVDHGASPPMEPAASRRRRVPAAQEDEHKSSSESSDSDNN